MERYDLNSIPKASTAEAGALRVANSTDEKNCGCIDAAITPSNLHNVLGSRKANTEYNGNEVVACPYQPGLLLKCVQKGSTDMGGLDTTNVTKGQIITDGSAKWEVINPLDDYLLLTGGTISGDIEMSQVDAVIRRGANNGQLRIFGGKSASGGANLDLLGENIANGETLKGAFVLRARNSNGYKELIGKTNGDLFWDEDKIATTNKLSMPNYKNRIGIDKTTTSYTAPCDGWLNVQANTNSTSFANIEIISPSGNYIQRAISYGNHGNAYNAYVPMLKGATYTIGANNSTISTIEFIYAASEV